MAPYSTKKQCLQRMSTVMIEVDRRLQRQNSQFMHSGENHFYENKSQ